ncbi:hypothetical protein [Xenococcus sp. PCC 7305]|uniref:hypothetical protein n=1 Tax=Xenococcus sp. PCC 7305 TaxID=102125 RepID=UPI0011818E88|nr:hypothetical protein [Xenococcus sp. PCC 7305]
MAIAQFRLMTGLNKQTMQTIDHNFSLVVDFLNRKLRKTSVHLVEVPCYFYQSNKSKLEITVFSNPRIATIDVRMIGLKNHDREPYFECSYDLNGLSIHSFQRDIEDLISNMD